MPVPEERKLSLPNYQSSLTGDPKSEEYLIYTKLCLRKKKVVKQSKRLGKEKEIQR